MALAVRFVALTHLATCFCITKRYDLNVRSLPGKRPKYMYFSCLWLSFRCGTRLALGTSVEASTPRCLGRCKAPVSSLVHPSDPDVGFTERANTMDWVYAALIFGSLAYYARAIVIEYTNYRTSITARINQIEDGVLDVGLSFATEEEEADRVRSRINSLQSEVAELRHQKTALFIRLATERERKQRLEIAIFRKRLKSKEPLVNT